MSASNTNYNPLLQFAENVDSVSSKSLPLTGDQPDVGNDTKFEFTHEWIKVSDFRLVCYYAGCILSCGLLVVASVNMPSLKLNLTSCSCQPAEACMVLLHLAEGTQEFCDLERYELGAHTYQCFEHAAVRYLASSENDFELTRVPSEPNLFNERFVETLSPSAPSRQELLISYGYNRLKLPVADAFTIVILEMLSPFYLFQYYAVGVWLGTNYIAYSIIILIITALSIYFVCSDKLFNIKRLHDLAQSSGRVRRISRPFEAVDTSPFSSSDHDLVPGDCFIVEHEMIFPCDAVLVKGKVVVDESMLTGESVPVTKTEFLKGPNNLDATKRKANMLYCGTKVKAIGSNESPIAVVYKTGFRSSRGMIIGTLARPQREIVSFMPDALRAIFFMVFLTTCVFGWSASELKKIGTSDKAVILAYLTALTIAVPPGLVACLSIATSISVLRLKQKQISISDTMKLNAAGYVSYACFDKTGTLTDENILFKGVELFRDRTLVENDSDMLQIASEVMAACHSLSLLSDGLAGDQLEMELFRESGWVASIDQVTKHLNVCPPRSIEKYTIVRNFEYSPEKLRAGVVLKGASSCRYLLKGSPEIIVQMSNPDSVPPAISQNMEALAKKGFRVLAMAYRNISSNSSSETDNWVNSASQIDLENPETLVFLGLVFFQNKLKPDTWPLTISNLQKANLKVNMITGDHIYTAVAIATECNILPPENGIGRNLYIIDSNESGGIVLMSEKMSPSIPLIELIELTESSFRQASVSTQPTRLALTGGALRSLQQDLNPEVFLRLIRCCSVFARVKPDQKKLIVNELKNPFDSQSKEQTYVLFCGDGANDMEALSVATVGVSLCDTATTVAASIVSLTQSPYSTVEVLKEGRCSLVTAYCLVLFNIMYAIIQYFMTCFLNNLGLLFGDTMYIVQDLFFSFFLGLAVSRNLPYETLTPNRPPPRLFTTGLMVRLFGQLAIFPCFQAILLYALTLQDWYTKFDPEGDPLTVSWAPECSSLQVLALAQLMIASVVVTVGKPFRLPWYQNRIHLVVLTIHASYIIFLLFERDTSMADALQNYPVPHQFAIVIIFIIIANAVTSALFAKLADWICPY